MLHADSRDAEVVRGAAPAVASRTAPLVAGGLALGACVYTALRDPSRQGGFLPCPFHAVTGLWCPGCGMTRGMHALLHGQVRAALGFNLLLVAVVPLAIYGWFNWLDLRPAGRRLPRLTAVPSQVWTVAVVFAFAFGVARNLPIAPLRALAP